MRLAADEITIRIGHEMIHLRPTLRAALRLERRHGGFDTIIRAVADSNVIVMSDVIQESTGGTIALARIITSIVQPDLKTGTERVKGPLAAHVLALAGFDPEAPSTPERATGATRMTFADRHAQLYRMATGWLGWTPETAWQSTPAEIIEAHRGRVELLKAIFGGKEDPAEPVYDETRDEAGWADLKLFAKSGGNRPR